MPTKTVSPTTSSSLASRITSPSRKLRFRRRRQSGYALDNDDSGLDSFTESSSTFSLDSSCPGSLLKMPSKKSTPTTKANKRSSMFTRFLGGSKTSSSSSSSPNGALVATSKKQIQVSAVPTLDECKNETSHSSTNRDDDTDDQSTSEDTLITTQAFEEAVSLEERGCLEHDAGQVQMALQTWNEAWAVAQDAASSSEDWTCLWNKIVCRLISLHLLHDHPEQAAALVEQLKQPDSGDCARNFLEPSTVLVELLMQHSHWSLALEIANQLPSCCDDPLMLARLHFENALLVVQDDTESWRSHAANMSHLSECHQLLLSCSCPTDKNAYLDLWQELAQAYSQRGEEELALGCIQSRLQHLTSPTEVALAHYEQALHVYAPSEQYEMALEEANVALETLRESPSKEDEERTLLLLKLYQFKADLLCRLNRTNESIDNYEILLQAYLDSDNHGPADAANICYILGKLSIRAKRFHNALAWFERELELTRSVVGNHHMAISKILHELARVADEGLMDYERSLDYYNRALQVESIVFRQLQKQSGSNNKSLLQDVKHQIGETKRCLGKLHFKMGDFHTALITTLAVDK